MDNLRANVVRIQQRGQGWSLRWSRDGEPELHPTAAEALKAVKQRDGSLAKAGMNIVTQVEWTTIDRIGTLVVRALTGAR